MYVFKKFFFSSHSFYKSICPGGTGNRQNGSLAAQQMPPAWPGQLPRGPHGRSCSHTHPLPPSAHGGDLSQQQTVLCSFSVVFCLLPVKPQSPQLGTWGPLDSSRCLCPASWPLVLWMDLPLLPRPWGLCILCRALTVLLRAMPFPASHQPHSCLSVKGHLSQGASSELFPHCKISQVEKSLFCNKANVRNFKSRRSGISMGHSGSFRQMDFLTLLR